MTLNPRVGVAPGTTTFTSNLGGCSKLLGSLGVCEPGYYGQSIMLPGSASPPMPLAGQRRWLVPYGSEAALRGGGMRWDLLALTIGLGFAGVLGFALWKRKR